MEIPEIPLQIETCVVSATNRKLKAIWSMETEQDLRSSVSIDQEQMLTDILAKEIQEEIDREILEDLRRKCEIESQKKPKKKPKKKIRSIADDWQIQFVD